MNFYLQAAGVCIYPLAAKFEGRWNDPVDDQGRPCVLHRHGYGKSPTVETPGVTATLTFTRPTPGPILDYTLSDPGEASERWPLVISTEDYNALDEDSRYEHYRGRAGEGGVETMTVDVSGHQPWPTASEDVPERPPVPDGVRWTPGTAWADLFGIPSHDHIVPGSLSGFHAAALHAIETHPSYLPASFGRERIERGKARGVNFTFFHEDGLSTAVKQGRRKTQRPLRETIRADIEIGPDTVPGVSMVDALAAWDCRLAQVVAQFPEPGKVCAHCRGLGFVR